MNLDMDQQINHSHHHIGIPLVPHPPADFARPPYFRPVGSLLAHGDAAKAAADVDAGHQHL